MVIPYLLSFLPNPWFHVSSFLYLAFYFRAGYLDPLKRVVPPRLSLGIQAPTLNPQDSGVCTCKWYDGGVQCGCRSDGKEIC